jgi:hypothetical protein
MEAPRVLPDIALRSGCLLQAEHNSSKRQDYQGDLLGFITRTGRFTRTGAFLLPVAC